MNTRRNAAPRLEKKVSNAGAPPHDEHVPPLKENANTWQAPVNYTLLTNENIRTALLQMAQAITTQ